MRSDSLRQITTTVHCSTVAISLLLEMPRPIWRHEDLSALPRSPVLIRPLPRSHALCSSSHTGPRAALGHRRRLFPLCPLPGCRSPRARPSPSPPSGLCSVTTPASSPDVPACHLALLCVSGAPDRFSLSPSSRSYHLTFIICLLPRTAEALSVSSADVPRAPRATPAT